MCDQFVTFVTVTNCHKFEFVTRFLCCFCFRAVPSRFPNRKQKQSSLSGMFFRISFFPNHFIAIIINRNRNRSRFVPVTIESVTICDICDQNVTKPLLLKKLEKRTEKQIWSRIQICHKETDSLWPSQMSQIGHKFGVTGTNLFLFLFGNPARNGS